MVEEKYARRIPNSEWEFHKSTIHRLYMRNDKPLTAPGGLLETMFNEHGFSAT